MVGWPSRQWRSPASFLTLLPGAAGAAPIGKDGRIFACYKVKGKPKGALRVLINRKALATPPSAPRPAR